MRVRVEELPHKGGHPGALSTQVELGQRRRHMAAQPVDVGLLDRAHHPSERGHVLGVPRIDAGEPHDPVGIEVVRERQLTGDERLASTDILGDLGGVAQSADRVETLRQAAQVHRGQEGGYLLPLLRRYSSFSYRKKQGLSSGWCIVRNCAMASPLDTM